METALLTLDPFGHPLAARFQPTSNLSGEKRRSNGAGFPVSHAGQGKIRIVGAPERQKKPFTGIDLAKIKG
jgi:hypothetical protein